MAVKKKAKKKKTAARPAKKAVQKKMKKQARKSTARKPEVKKASARTAKKAISKKRESAAVSSRANAVAASIPPALRKRNELLKKILLKKRNEVVEGLEAQMGRKLTRETGQRIDAAMDSADQSSRDMDLGIDYSLLEMRYEQYKDIAEAFRKLQNNTFGLCEECGEEIDIKRLQVNPLARYCIACKTKKEEIERIQKEETRFKE
jgi:DnaK suppressor protein